MTLRWTLRQAKAQLQNDQVQKTLSHSTYFEPGMQLIGGTPKNVASVTNTHQGMRIIYTSRISLTKSKMIATVITRKEDLN
jgi:hypothetical protein